MKEIQIGATFTVDKYVAEDLLALSVGSGDVCVFATPMMIAMMEEAAAKCVGQFLEEGMTSVGTSISCTHTAATPLGMKVSATAVIVGVDGRKVSLTLSACDAVGPIGEGAHERFIVNREKFNAKALSKLVD